ncbi:MAG: glucokinase [Reyranellaceae bacterium]
MILAGDIGGTNTRLALYRRDLTRAVPLRVERFRNDDFASVHEIVARFLAGQEKPAVACFGVAGLVDGGRCHLTNRNWTIAEQALAIQIGAPALLVNDVAAAAIGVAHLDEDGYVVLQPGSRSWGRGNIAVVAPGTGLGQAAAIWDGARHHPLATEAGHADFAPVLPIELELSNWLRARYGGHASIERVLSGPAMADIARFLVASGRCRPVAAVHSLPEREQPAALTRLALEGEEPLAAATLDLFVAALAREAGSAALRFLALGGVALAGGIPPRLLPVLRQPHFIETLVDKGRFAALMRSLPVRVVIDPDVAMLGAAHLAASA